MTTNTNSIAPVTNPLANLSPTPTQNVQSFKYETSNAGELASILASLNISIPQNLLDQSLFKVESTSTTSTSGLNNNNLGTIKSNNQNSNTNLLSIPAYLTNSNDLNKISSNGISIN